MKILVPVKRVADASTRVTIKPDGSGIDLTGVRMSMNPFDEIAVEEAVRLKEAGQSSEVVAVSVGPAKAEDVLRLALAMGADRGILVEVDADVEPLAIAKILTAIARAEQPGLIILGKQAIDDDCSQTGQMLAALLNVGQATFASKLEIADDMALVTREIDGGLQLLQLPLPAVVTTDLRLNTPRFVSLPNVLKARQKPLQKTTPATLGVGTAPRLTVLKTEMPKPRKRGIRVGSVAELLDRLRTEASLP